MDAITFLFVGNTFVSNQTGNIMLLAMNAAGAQAADVGAAIVSLIGFVVGAALTGRLVREGLSGPQAPTRIPTVLWLEVALISIGTLIDALTDLSARLTVAPLAVAMGMQATLGARIALLYLTPGFTTGIMVRASMRSPIGDRSEPWWWYAAIAVTALGAGAALSAVVARETITGALVLLGGLVLVAVGIASSRSVVA